jgi:multiple sugar transport system substrate-binding protein
VPPDEYQAYVGGEHPLHPRGLKLAELNGRTYGVPYVFSTPTLFYNADLFRQAGLDPDQPPTTWTEVKQVGLQLKQRTGKFAIDVSCLGRFDWCFQGLVLSNGGRVLSEDRSRLMFGEPATAEAVAMWQDLVKSGLHPPTALSGADGFSGGNVAMLLTTSAVQSSLLAAFKDHWELRTAAMPAFEGKPVRPTNSGSAVYILADDPAKQRAAWELMKFLTSERGYTIIQSKIGYLPLRPSIVNDERYLKAWVAAHPLVQPNLKQLDSLEPWVAFPGPNYQNIRATMMKAVEEVVLGGADPQATLADAQQRAAQMLPRR